MSHWEDAKIFSMGRLAHDSQDYLFRGKMHNKSGECLRKSGSVTVSCAPCTKI